MTYIPETDLYRLILRTKLPNDKKFETWFVKIVLPTIRKHGAYINPFSLKELRSNTNKTAKPADNNMKNP